MKYTQEQLTSACMTWRHDFGMLPADERAGIERQMAQVLEHLPEPAAPLSMSAYQSLAQRTANRSLVFDTRLAVAALGLIGEAAEVSEHVKKYLGHGHELDRSKVLSELGDLGWYLAELASIFDADLGAVAEANIAKLRVRYKDGFSEEASRNRPSGNGG